MKTSELKFNYPEELVATEPKRPSRVMWVNSQERSDLAWPEFLSKFKSGDLIVVNDTKVTPLRVWAKPADLSTENLAKEVEEADILFVKELPNNEWEVLAPFKKMKGREWILPDNVRVVETTSGIPQKIKLDRKIGPDYFAKHGEVPLPPYILKARGDRHSHEPDEKWYQSIFAKIPDAGNLSGNLGSSAGKVSDEENLGSSAAPTASLHFSLKDFDQLKSQGVEFATLTLHVGLGTYLPVTSDDLDQHKMHFEEVHIPLDTWKKVSRWAGHAPEGRVFALGTTVARALESAVIGKLKKTESGFHGSTDLLIQPGYDFKIVRALMTNFHQPESTLLALVAAFAGLENVKEAYAWAIEKKYRLFSYGDLTVWEP